MTQELTFDELALIAGGHTAFQLLWAGVNLGVFETLANQPESNFSDITQAIGIEEQPSRILLTGLATLRLIVKEGSNYRNSSIVQELLTRTSPNNMIDVLGWQHHIVYPAEIDFIDSLKSNKNVGLRHFPGDEDNLYQRIAHKPELEKVFHDAMSSLSRSANQLLAEKVDFSATQHLVDAGGGDGTNAITLARANPHLSLTIFDAPSVCELARKNISTANLSDRIGTHEGNFFVTDFPGSIDGIIYSHMLTIWSPEKNISLLKRSYEALPEGGKLFIFNMMANDNGVGPMATALGSPYFLTIATGEGMLYSWQDYEDFLAQAGFKQTERHELPKNHGVIVGIK